MSVITTADEKLEEARNQLKSAFSNLTQVIDPNTYGHKTYNSNFMEKVMNSIPELYKIIKNIS